MPESAEMATLHVRLEKQNVREISFFLISFCCVFAYNVLIDGSLQQGSTWTLDDIIGIPLAISLLATVGFGLITSDGIDDKISCLRKKEREQELKNK